jgi:hypothetical protein
MPKASIAAKIQRQTPYAARAFVPAHPDLARSAGVPAQLADEDYVEALARVVYYWGYPAVDLMSRTSQWQLMKDGRERSPESPPAGRSVPWATSATICPGATAPPSRWF